MPLNDIDKKQLQEIIRGEKDIDALLRSLSKEMRAVIERKIKDDKTKDLAAVLFALSPLVDMFWDEVESVIYERGGNINNYVIGKERKYFKDYAKKLKRQADPAKLSVIRRFESKGVKEFDAFQDRSQQLIKGRKIDGKTIGQRITLLKGSTKRNVQNILAVDIEKGKSAREIAKDIDGYLNPVKGNYKSPFDYYRDRFKDGKKVKIFGKQIQKGYISEGSVSYQSLRIARTEINMTARETMKRMYKGVSFVKGYKWHLSGSHPNIGCECEELASREILKEVPSLPHPNCMCYVTTILKKPEEFIDEI
jgi:hypothetical protein